MSATSLKKSPVQVFSCEFCEISKSTFLNRTPRVTVSQNSIEMFDMVLKTPLILLWTQKFRSSPCVL